MSNLFDSIVIGDSGDVGKITSERQHNLQVEGDTIKISNQRPPTHNAYTGEICWNYVNGSANLYLCVEGAQLDIDGEILVPAVWHVCQFQPPLRSVKQS